MAVPVAANTLSCRKGKKEKGCGGAAAGGFVLLV